MNHAFASPHRPCSRRGDISGLAQLTTQPRSRGWLWRSGQMPKTGQAGCNRSGRPRPAGWYLAVLPGWPSADRGFWLLALITWDCDLLDHACSPPGRKSEPSVGHSLPVVGVNRQSRRRLAAMLTLVPLSGAIALDIPQNDGARRPVGAGSIMRTRIRTHVLLGRVAWPTSTNSGCTTGGLRASRSRFVYGILLHVDELPLVPPHHWDHPLFKCGESPGYIFISPTLVRRAIGRSSSERSGRLAAEAQPSAK